MNRIIIIIFCFFSLSVWAQKETVKIQTSAPCLDMSCCKDILYKIEGKWTWIESMNEGQYDYNKELI